MAKPKLCSIDGCGKPSCTRGWCNAHYRRWLHHGSPLGGSTANGVPHKLLFGTVISLKQNDCFIWPYSQDPKGYGRIEYKGRKWLIHRLVCELTYGPPPTAKHHAAHSCGNTKCCNPQHIRWATPSENLADRIIHGTSNRGAQHGLAKLTADDVRRIRELSGTMSQSEIAKLFGIKFQTVSDIHRRKRWAWLD